MLPYGVAVFFPDYSFIVLLIVFLSFLSRAGVNTVQFIAALTVGEAENGMTLRFIHTSDWQIGKVFRFVDDATMGLLQEARLSVINRLGRLAQHHKVHHVLVAGDVYDMEELSPRSLNQPLERMRLFDQIQWHLLPGNHDPHRPRGIWERFTADQLPKNVVLHLDAQPWMSTDHQPKADADFVILPAPLHYRQTLQDPTAYMNEFPSQANQFRVGFAHGSIAGFGTDDKATANYIAPNRAELASLDYLALGDWHGQKRINDRTWYSGTPETDSFSVEGEGRALLVEITEPGARPTVTVLETGQYVWQTVDRHLSNREDIDRLAQFMRSCHDQLEQVLLYLKVAGTLSLQDRRYFEEQITEQASAALCYMRLDDSALLPSPSAEDLDHIDRGGFVRVAAESLKVRAESGNTEEAKIAALALDRLFTVHMQLRAKGI